MARLTAYVAINMWNPPAPWVGDVVDATPTSVTLTNYSKIGVYSGTGFSFKGYNVVGGVLNGYSEYTYDFNPLYVVSGLSLQARTVGSYIKAGLISAIYSQGLKGNDSILGSNEDDFLRGFGGNDRISGRDGTDIIFGDKGNDILSGGLGDDGFVFNFKPTVNNFDTITDFNSGSDGLIFDASVFRSLPTQSDLSSNYVVGRKAIDNDDFLIFNPLNNILYYDADGSGIGKRVAIVKLTGITELDPSVDLISI